MGSPKGNCIPIADLDWSKKELIGKGRFGSVYKTNWSTYDEDGNEEEYTVAVKCPIGVPKDRILDERDIKSDLWHENIVNILGFAQLNHNRKVALVFEYTDEGTVYDFIWERRDKGGATAERMMEIALDIAKGMEYLHANSYVHGDLALRNCIMDADGNVQVGDLGLYEGGHDSCYFSDSSTNGSIPCPVRWMAPENLPFKYSTKPQMIRKQHTKSYRGDVWACGVVLYELWTRGEDPFEGCDNDQLVCKHVLDGVTAATYNSRLKIRSSMESLMKRCFRFNPNERPTFEVIVREFETLMGSGGDSDLEDYADLDQSEMTCSIMDF